MNMTLQHQVKSVFADGTSVPGGEDGRPYAKDGILIIADGMGGRGGFPHSSINPDILDKDKFYNIAFKNVFDTTDDEFKEYVLTGFSELFSLADSYFTDTAHMKHSGYFASRLVSAIVLYELKFNPEFSKEKIFEPLNSADEASRDDKLQLLGDRLAELIREKLEVIAANTGLKMESKVNGACLLPTTLVVAVTDEHEDSVDIAYFWAGDSRGYILNSDGLSQITNDHESAEVMTNKITLTNSFRIETRYLSQAKPVIVFNTSDGCYKCEPSPLNMEFAVLTAINESDNLMETSALLNELYERIGSNDDSQTMALTAFGYEDFPDLKKAAQARLDNLHATYTKNSPHILEQKYLRSLETVVQESESALISEILDSESDNLYASKDIRSYIGHYIQNTYHRNAYITEQNNLNANLTQLENDSRSIRQKIYEWVKKNWIFGAGLSEYTKLTDHHDSRRAMDVIKKRDKCASKYAEKQPEYAEALSIFKAESSNIDELFDFVSMLSIDKPGIKGHYDAISDYIRKLKDIISKVETLTLSMKNNISEYMQATEGLDPLVDRILSKDDELIRKLTDEIITGEFSLDAVEMPGSLRNEIMSHLDSFESNRQRAEELKKEKRELADKYASRIWKSRELRRKILAEIWNEYRAMIPADIHARLSASIEEMKKRREACLEEFRALQEMYSEYDKIYKMYLKESRI